MKQKPKSQDCMLVVAAMATNQDIETIRSAVGQKKGPYTIEQIISVLQKFGKQVIEISSYDLENQAIVIVEDYHTPDMPHAIWWDGEQVWDPDPEREDNLPIFNAYVWLQWLTVI